MNKKPNFPEIDIQEKRVSDDGPLNILLLTYHGDSSYKKDFSIPSHEIDRKDLHIQAAKDEIVKTIEIVSDTRANVQGMWEKLESWKYRNGGKTPHGWLVSSNTMQDMIVSTAHLQGSVLYIDPSSGHLTAWGMPIYPTHMDTEIRIIL